MCLPKNYTGKNCFQILVVIKFLSFLFYCHLLFDVILSHTRARAHWYKIWMFKLTLTIYKRIMQIGWVFFLLCWENCYLGTQHFEKEIKCDLLSSDPAISFLQILFILWWVRTFHIIILQHFIILIFFKHFRTRHTLAKASTR